MRILSSTLLCLLACSPTEEGSPEPAEEVSAPAQGAAAGPEPVATAKPEQGGTPSPPLVATEQDRWGALFWRDEIPSKVGGGGTIAMSRTVLGNLVEGEPGSCGGSKVNGAPKDAVVVLPDGAHADPPGKSPPIQAALVERAAWRLDGLLPARDEWSPATSAPDPALQRGVRIGSVMKTRRYGSPPMLVVTGVRECTGALALVDAEALKTYTGDTFPSCDTVQALPATDLDGDGARELVVYGSSTVRVYRLVEAPGTLDLVLLAQWTCQT